MQNSPGPRIRKALPELILVKRFPPMHQNASTSPLESSAFPPQGQGKQDRKWNPSNFLLQLPPPNHGMCRGGRSNQTRYSQSANEDHLHSIFLGAGSAYADVTFEDAWPLQLLCDYYLVYTPGHR
jgi:hypothetical protein